MCRVNDDFDWIVEATNPEAVSETDEHCEDCGRKIPVGEPHTVFTAMVDEVEREQSPLVFVAQHPKPGQTYFDESRPFIRLPDFYEDPLTDNAFEALGFITDEVSEYDLVPHEPQYHISCNHCRAANIWLEKVCDQTTVLITVEDLASHWDDYTPEQLGASFRILYNLSRQQWRSGTRLVSVKEVAVLAETAAEFALAGNLVHD